MKLDKNTTLVLLLAIQLGFYLAVLATAVFLSVYTGNYKWMWLISIILLTSFRASVDDEDTKDKEDKNA